VRNTPGSYGHVRFSATAAVSAGFEARVGDLILATDALCAVPEDDIHAVPGPLSDPGRRCPAGAQMETTEDRGDARAVWLDFDIAGDHVDSPSCPVGGLFPPMYRLVLGRYIMRYWRGRCARALGAVHGCSRDASPGTHPVSLERPALQSRSRQT
jgi:hypothetical protein